jgi:hypothetical protein
MEIELIANGIQQAVVAQAVACGITQSIGIESLE